MNIAYYVLKLLLPKAKEFEKNTKDSLKTQKKILFEFLKRNANTEYGKKYNFSGIKTIEDYQSRVPLVNFECIRPYVDRLMKGQGNILTKDKVIFFGTTSGTTDKPKFIPVTKFSESRKNKLLDLWAYYISKDHPKVFEGHILAIVSPEVDGFTESGLPYGAESGHEYKKLPGLIRKLYVLPYEVFEIKDYESRYYTILRISMEHNITTVVTLNPTSILILCNKIESLKDRIIKDIEKGALDESLNIEKDIRLKLEKLFKPNPKRANELKEILRRKKELHPKYFWPKLELIECWKGGTVKIYLKEFPRYFGNIPIRDLGCLSTEASSSIPISDKGAGGVLSISTNFYEFISKEDIDKPRKRILLSNELRIGEEYYIIITTAAGLYRYNIDDIIKVRGYFNNTPVIEFIQKGHNAISMTGEKLYESQVVEAVNKALRKNNLSVTFISSFSEPKNIPRYVFLVEFLEEIPFSRKKSFLESIEIELYKQNVQYKEIREQGLLGCPELRIVEKGSFERYRAKKIAEGSHEGQFKIPELTNDTQFQNNFNVIEKITLDIKECKKLQYY